ncbi:hypothetical protein ACS0TY_033397 [Phlomoides rotata]
MEAPPPPPPLTAAPPIPPAAPTAPVYADSVDSSPRSRHTDSWDNDAPPSQPPQKLRLMCSYGGHIIPRPHDKTLCYIGGDTRIIVIDRHTTLSDLRHRLSKTLLNSQSFCLKYQLPNEDLDSLISVTTDEDLENMVEEYERLNNGGGGGLKPGRLRLFLFPQTSSNIEQLLVETASTKSDDWFFNALNGKGSTLSAAASDRGFSESSSVNCLLGLDDDLVGKAAAVGGKDADAQIEGSKVGGNGNTVANQDVHSVPDSPIMLETTSSFGSTSSSPSVANLPPIRVHVEENQKAGGLGIEDQFQQMTVGLTGNVNSAALTPKQEEVGAFVAAGVTAGTVVSGVPLVVGGGEYPNRGYSDDERSDHGGYRKVQQIQPQAQLQPHQIPQYYQKQTSAIDLASPDSVSSDGSLTNPLSRQRQAMYQEQFIQMQPANTRVAANPSDLKSGDQNSNKIQMQPQVQDSGYVLSSQYDQNHPQLHHPQQFVHAGNQYIPAGAVPLQSYYSIYPSQQQHHHPHQPVLDQQYPVYFVPARQPQAYNMQQSYSELAPNAPTNRPQTPPTAIASHTPFNQGINPPSSKPEMAQGVYRTAAGTTPHMVQVPSHQHQPQYMGFTQIHHPSQMIAPSSAPNSSYTYEFADPTHTPMYYTQALPPQMAAQYQTMTSVPAVAPPDTSSQGATESMKQQVRT